MRKTFFLVLCSFALLTQSCGGGSGGSTGSPKVEASTGEVCTGVRIDNQSSCIELDGREAIVRMPSANEAKGVALVLHGAPGSPEKVMNIFGADLLASELDLAVVVPEGSRTTWGWASMNASSFASYTDVDFLAELVGKIQAENGISSDKLYVFGYSAGGFMAYRFACERPEMVSAIVSLAGQFRGELNACNRDFPVPLHHFHSLTDREVSYYGREAGSIVSVSDTIAHWRFKNGCSEEYVVTEHPGVTSSSTGTTTETFQNCQKSVTLSKMTGVAHEAQYLADRMLAIYRHLFNE